jgi:hypothetical protein
MSSFDSRISALRKEVEALKSVKKKSSLTLSTISKTIRCYGSLYKYSTPLGDVIVPRMAGLVKIIPKDDGDCLLGYSQPSYSARGNRRVDATRWLDGDSIGVACTPYRAASDSSLPYGVSNIPITITITCTSDFDYTVGQILARSS